MTTSEIQIRQCYQNMDLAAVLGQATQPGLLEAELLLDHPKRMLHLGCLLVNLRIVRVERQVISINLGSPI